MCKVCDCSIVNEINDRILANESYKDIELWLRGRNVRISHMSLKRHHDSGHCGTKRNTPLPSTESEAYFSFTTMNSEFTQQDSHNLLKQAYAMQLQIVTIKQRAYLDGTGRYPQAEIAGLKNILDCIAVITRGGDGVLRSEPANENDLITRAFHDLIKQGNVHAVMAAREMAPPKEFDKVKTLREIKENIYGIFD